MMKKFNIVLVLLSLIYPKLVTAKTSDEVITGTYEYSSLTENIIKENTYTYKDEYFAKSSYIGNEELEILSIETSSASISKYGDDSVSSDNINKMLKSMNFSNIMTNNYYKIEKESYSMGVIIGSKNIIVDDINYTLLAVVPRSAGYKDEWLNNFMLGDSFVHEGFKTARDEVLRFMKKYIKDNNIQGNLKVWVPGYSRGAAIANSVAGFLASGTDYFENVTIDSKNIYSYSIGTPSVIKNSASKNTFLSVSASVYPNDTLGDAYTYTLGGVIDTNDVIYNGIYNIINPKDLFPLLPPKYLGFTRFGNTIDATSNMDEEAMLNNLKTISKTTYDLYSKTFNEYTFDLDTISIKKINVIDQAKYINDKLNSISSVIKTTKDYKDNYEKIITSLAGIYSVSDPTSLNISIDNIKDYIPTISYVVLSSLSDNLIDEGKATSEDEAVTIILTDIIKYITKEEVDYKTLTLDELVTIVAKYISSNEALLDMIVNAIVDAVPEDYKFLLPAFKVFDKSEAATTESGIKEFIKACYYGVDPDSDAYSSFKTAKETRYFLYSISGFLLSNYPDVLELMHDGDYNITGDNKISDFVREILKVVKTEVDEDGNVIKTYERINELAKASFINMIDTLAIDYLNEVETNYGANERNKVSNHINNIKDNIDDVISIIDIVLSNNKIDDLINEIITFVSNVDLIIMPHYDELYLAMAKASNHYPIYECIKGDNEEFNLKNNKLSFEFSFDFDDFKNKGVVYLDNEEVDKSNYTLSKGSTIITFKDNFAKKLSSGSHKIVAYMNGIDIEASFKINYSNDTNNPDTSDNIFVYISLLTLSVLGLYKTKKVLGFLIYKKTSFLYKG